MVSQYSPSVSPPTEGDTPLCNYSAITPDEAWVFAYQANLSPDDFEEIFEEVEEVLEIAETEQAVMAFSQDDTPDIGGEFTTSGTDKSNWLPGHDATDDTTEFLL